MYGYLWVVGTATTVIAAVLCYAMTRRYGWGTALALPLMALATMIALQWQAEELGLADGMRLVGMSVLFSAPVLLGALAGVAVARWRRRRD